MAKLVPPAPEVLELLRGFPPVPVYLFIGTEDLLVEEAIDLVVTANLSPDQRGFNLDNVYAGDLDVRQILAMASSFPMMADRRVVVVRGVDRFSDKDLGILSGHVEHPPPTTALILVAERVDRRKKPFNAVKDIGFVGEFNTLREDALHRWVKMHVTARGGTISPEATKRLVTHAGPALRSVRNEIDKLFTYLGNSTSISEGDVSAIVGLSREHNVFELQRAIGERNLPRATQILERLIDAGENVPLIIITLTSYFMKILRVWDLRQRGRSNQEIAKEAGIAAYLNEYLEAADRFTGEQIERAFLLLASADEKIKSTRLDPRQIMHELLIELLTVSQPMDA